MTTCINTGTVRKEVTGLQRITKKRLLELCKKNKLYQTPSLNDVLYLHFQGFQYIECLEEYTELKCLWLECNAICEIQGLENQPKLKCLFLQNNLIKHIENLQHCAQLDTLNLASNHIRKIENCGSDILPCLNTLNLSSNYLQDSDSLRELEKCLTISVLDLANNRIDDILVVKVFGKMPQLRVLVLQGNPVVSKVPQYRKTLILECKELTYLDSRPVFPIDRACAEAWKRGGYAEERKENERWKRADRRKIRDSVNATLRLRNRYKDPDQQKPLLSSSDSEVDEDERRKAQAEVGANMCMEMSFWDDVEDSKSDSDLNVSSSTSFELISTTDSNSIDSVADVKAVGNTEMFSTINDAEKGENDISKKTPKNLEMGENDNVKNALVLTEANKTETQDGEDGEKIEESVNTEKIEESINRKIMENKIDLEKIKEPDDIEEIEKRDNIRKTKDICERKLDQQKTGGKKRKRVHFADEIEQRVGSMEKTPYFNPNSHLVQRKDIIEKRKRIHLTEEISELGDNCNSVEEAKEDYSEAVNAIIKVTADDSLDTSSLPKKRVRMQIENINTLDDYDYEPDMKEIDDILERMQQSFRDSSAKMTNQLKQFVLGSTPEQRTYERECLDVNNKVEKDFKDMTTNVDKFFEELRIGKKKELDDDKADGGNETSNSSNLDDSFSTQDDSLVDEEILEEFGTLKQKSELKLLEGNEKKVSGAEFENELLESENENNVKVVGAGIEYKNETGIKSSDAEKKPIGSNLDLDNDILNAGKDNNDEKVSLDENNKFSHTEDEKLILMNKVLDEYTALQKLNFIRKVREKNINYDFSRVETKTSENYLVREESPPEAMTTINAEQVNEVVTLPTNLDYHNYIDNKLATTHNSEEIEQHDNVSQFSPKRNEETDEAYAKEAKELKELLQKLENENDRLFHLNDTYVEMLERDIESEGKYSERNADDGVEEFCEYIVDELLDTFESDKEEVQKKPTVNYPFPDIESDEDYSYSEKDKPEEPVKTMREVVTSFNNFVQEMTFKNREYLIRERAASTDEEKAESLKNLLQNSSAQIFQESSETIDAQFEELKERKALQVRKMVDRVYAQKDKYDDTLDVVEGKLVVVKKDTGDIEDLPELVCHSDSDNDNDEYTTADSSGDELGAAGGWDIYCKHSEDANPTSKWTKSYKPTKRISAESLIYEALEKNRLQSEILDDEHNDSFGDLNAMDAASADKKLFGNIDKDFFNSLDFKNVVEDENDENHIVVCARSYDELRKYLRKNTEELNLTVEELALLEKMKLQDTQDNATSNLVKDETVKENLLLKKLVERNRRKEREENEENEDLEAIEEEFHELEMQEIARRETRQLVAKLVKIFEYNLDNSNTELQYIGTETEEQNKELASDKSYGDSDDYEKYEKEESKDLERKEVYSKDLKRKPSENDMKEHKKDWDFEVIAREGKAADIKLDSLEIQKSASSFEDIKIDKLSEIQKATGSSAIEKEESKDFERKPSENDTKERKTDDGFEVIAKEGKATDIKLDSSEIQKSTDSFEDTKIDKLSEIQKATGSSAIEKEESKDFERKPTENDMKEHKTDYDFEVIAKEGKATDKKLDSSEMQKSTDSFEDTKIDKLSEIQNTTGSSAIEKEESNDLERKPSQNGMKEHKTDDDFEVIAKEGKATDIKLDSSEIQKSTDFLEDTKIDKLSEIQNTTGSSAIEKEESNDLERKPSQNGMKEHKTDYDFEVIAKEGKATDKKLDSSEMQKSTDSFEDTKIDKLSEIQNTTGSSAIEKEESNDLERKPSQNGMKEHKTDDDFEVIAKEGKATDIKLDSSKIQKSTDFFEDTKIDKLSEIQNTTGSSAIETEESNDLERKPSQNGMKEHKTDDDFEVIAKEGKATDKKLDSSEMQKSTDSFEDTKIDKLSEIQKGTGSFKGVKVDNLSEIQKSTDFVKSKDTEVDNLSQTEKSTNSLKDIKADKFPETTESLIYKKVDILSEMQKPTDSLKDPEVDNLSETQNSTDSFKDIKVDNLSELEKSSDSLKYTVVNKFNTDTFKNTETLKSTDTIKGISLLVSKCVSEDPKTDLPEISQLTLKKLIELKVKSQGENISEVEKSDEDTSLEWNGNEKKTTKDYLEIPKTLDFLSSERYDDAACEHSNTVSETLKIDLLEISESAVNFIEVKDEKSLSAPDGMDSKDTFLKESEIDTELQENKKEIIKEFLEIPSSIYNLGLRSDNINSKFEYPIMENVCVADSKLEDSKLNVNLSGPNITEEQKSIVVPAKFEDNEDSSEGSESSSNTEMQVGKNVNMGINVFRQIEVNLEVLNEINDEIVNEFTATADVIF